MGKKDHILNKPSNSSLSWTSDGFVTHIEATKNNTSAWEPLSGPYAIQLNEKSIDRFLVFWQFLRDEFQIKDNYLIKSNNNFPFGCGLASSASSFSALVKLACAIQPNHGKSLSELALLSAKGSGSSCRSLIDGWVQWDDSGVSNVSDIPYKNIIHKVVILEDSEKKVSSSQAHKNIQTSLLNTGRAERAEKRLIDLKSAFLSKDWQQAYQICWAEFKDMHALFETAMPAFSYYNDQTQLVLDKLQVYWDSHVDGPLVTMDAGPNVHMLFREDQASACDNILNNTLNGFKVL